MTSTTEVYSADSRYTDIIHTTNAKVAANKLRGDMYNSACISTTPLELVIIDTLHCALLLPARQIVAVKLRRGGLIPVRPVDVGAGDKVTATGEGSCVKVMTPGIGSRVKVTAATSIVVNLIEQAVGARTARRSTRRRCRSGVCPRSEIRRLSLCEC